MKYLIESSKWGPFISFNRGMVFYDFILDRSANAKDILPQSSEGSPIIKYAEDPIITYHMWYSPKDLKSLTGDILAARTLDGLERELEIAKREAIRRANKDDLAILEENNPKITTEKHTRYFLFK